MEIKLSHWLSSYFNSYWLWLLPLQYDGKVCGMNERFCSMLLRPPGPEPEPSSQTKRKENRHYLLKGNPVPWWRGCASYLDHSGPYQASPCYRSSCHFGMELLASVESVVGFSGERRKGQKEWLSLRKSLLETSHSSDQAGSPQSSRQLRMPLNSLPGPPYLIMHLLV